MLRFLLRRLPRFGFLTLFAAMLLFVSGAGWFKFQYDRYLEEERLLADLAKAGCQVLIERFSEPSRSSAPAETAWTPLPQLDRMRNMRIKHPATIEPALIERAARLPLLRTLEIEPLAAPAVPVATTNSFDDLGIAIPSFDEAATPDLEVPIPPGQPVSDERKERIASGWNAAWSKSEKRIEFGTVRTEIHYPAFGGPIESLEIHRDGASICALPENFTIANPRRISGFTRDSPGARLRETFRCLDPETLEWRRGDDFTLPYQRLCSGRLAFERYLDLLEPDELKQRLLSNLDDRHIESISAGDGGLVRVELSTIAFEQPWKNTQGEVACIVLLRPDREYAVEAFDMHVVRTDAAIAAGDPTSATFRWRGAASDHAGHYLLDAAAFDEPGFSGYKPSLPVNQRYTARFAYDLAQEPPAELFEPAAFDAVELPSPRPLPFWRWYRVTLAIGLAILAFVAGRKIVARFRRPSSRLRSSEAVEAPEASADEPAATF